MSKPLDFKFIESILSDVIISMSADNNEPISIEVGKEEWAVIYRETVVFIDLSNPTMHGLPLIRVDDQNWLKVCNSVQTGLRQKYDECLSKIKELEKDIFEQSKGLIGKEIQNRILTNQHREAWLQQAVNCKSRMTPPITILNKAV